MPLAISVGDAVKEGSGFGSYISFQVTTRGLLNFPGHTVQVARNFKDFEWLVGMLKSDLPGSVIPPLPPKFHMDMHEIKGRFQESGFPPEFLAARTAGLEKFLNKVAAHELLSCNDHFKMFLQQKDDELKEHQVDEPNVEKFKKALNWIDVRVAEVIKGFTEKSPGDEGYDEDTQNDSPVDAKMKCYREYIIQVDDKLQQMSKSMKEMLQKKKLANDKLSEFSDAALELGEFELDQEPVANSLKKLAKTTADLSDESDKHLDDVQEKFAAPLAELVELLGSIKAAIMDQVTARHKWMLAQKNLENKTKGHEKLAAKLHEDSLKPKPIGEAKAPEETLCDVRALPQPCQAFISPLVDEDTVSHAEMAIHEAQDELATAANVLEHVTGRVLKEIDTFKKDKSGELKKIIEEYATIQVEYNEREKAKWQALLI